VLLKETILLVVENYASTCRNDGSVTVKESLQTATLQCRASFCQKMYSVQYSISAD